jgi:hypothetical protein
MEWLEYVLCFFVMVVLTTFYLNSDTFQLKCVISKVDGNTYCVRDNAYVKQSADLLAEVTLRMKKLVQHMKEKYSQRTDVQRLIENFNPSRIVETLPTSLHTAYSEDKGKKIAFCLQKQKEDMKRIDINTLTFVAIHELSHLMTESIGHEQAFWKNFKFLLKNAVAIGIYDSIDYQQQPEPYCGMTIDDNPLYA